MSQSICYEQPLNERARALLRLEFLFQQINHALIGPSTWNSRAALQGLFNILTVTGRNEFKKELLKELERHASTLSRLRQSPGIDTVALSSVLAKISEVIGQIHRPNSLALDTVRQSEFLGAIQNRIQIPGGTCRFDLPALHHWLQQEPEIRNRDLQEWLAPFSPMRDAVFLILQLIRDSATPRTETAIRGFFQRGLDANAPNQLIRVWLPSGDPRFPEISGGRHRFTIHFLEQSNPYHRATPSLADVAFDLACCII
ncbi:MAG: cell division protein ZapD [Gammaproteobacteria bacterium]|nr:cell division protein ZapD [Gammaproteobacteria bacterium]